MERRMRAVNWIVLLLSTVSIKVLIVDKSILSFLCISPLPCCVMKNRFGKELKSRKQIERMKHKKNRKRRQKKRYAGIKIIINKSIVERYGSSEQLRFLDGFAVAPCHLYCSNLADEIPCHFLYGFLRHMACCNKFLCRASG